MITFIGFFEYEDSFVNIYLQIIAFLKKKSTFATEKFY